LWKRRQIVLGWIRKDICLLSPGEPIYGYAEPRNYTITDESGTYHIYFALDFNLYDKDGKSPGEVVRQYNRGKPPYNSQKTKKHKDKNIKKQIQPRGKHPPV